MNLLGLAVIISSGVIVLFEARGMACWRSLFFPFSAQVGNQTAFPHERWLSLLAACDVAHSSWRYSPLPYITRLDVVDLRRLIHLAICYIHFQYLFPGCASAFQARSVGPW